MSRVRELKEAGSLHLAEEAETKRRAFLLKPDILVRKGLSPRVVADTKWKRLDPRSADLGVSGEDVYQVLAYVHRYATDTAVPGEVGEAVGAGLGANYGRLVRGRRLGAEADAVTALLEKALAEISKLPPPQREEVATWLLAELTDEGHWASSFARSQPTLDTLADEALAEHSAGLTESLDPERP